MRPVLITGGAGFVGTNTAHRLLSAGRGVRILDDLSRPGVETNLEWLADQHGSRLEVEIGDVRNRDTVRRALRGVHSVYHFAAQVAVTTSLQAPMDDAAVNLLGTLNVLEEARTRPRPPAIIFTSTNKVYGSLPDVDLVENDRRYEPRDPGLRATGVGEARPLDFCTPYGCSKGAADQYVLDWSTSFAVPTVVFRMSCIYGPHQCGTEDQGWVAHFLISGVDDRPITIYGTGKQVRDVLYVNDLVDALLLAGDRAGELAGTAFNIGGGPANAVSLLEVLEIIGEQCGRRPDVRSRDWRAGDQRYYVSDTSAFTRATGWAPRVDPAQGIGALYSWLTGDRSSASAAA
jgi:CDP-paratose 2-epimerase